MSGTPNFSAITSHPGSGTIRLPCSARCTSNASTTNLASPGARCERRKASPLPNRGAYRRGRSTTSTGFCSNASKDAKRLRLIPDNPAADVKRRRIKRAGREGAADMHALPLDRMVALFDTVRAANLKSLPHPLALLAFDSGARRGELLAARWCDLDLDRRTLRIERAVDETEAHGVTIKDSPKNESSRRTITLSVQTIATLRAWRARQIEDRLKLGAQLPADALIFPLSVETPTMPLRPREVTKAFSRLVKREGFAPFRFHDFRHSCASHLLARGVPVPEVSRHLGHSSPQVTMTVYAHAIPDANSGVGLLDQLMPVATAAE